MASRDEKIMGMLEVALSNIEFSTQQPLARDAERSLLSAQAMAQIAGVMATLMISERLEGIVDVLYDIKQELSSIEKDIRG